ncbi:Diacylglycerol acyltransferase - like 7 [Theobroma cacao]|nr:Diacylglycerol acyltransferase - like 2 [Theobroma cacao]WRX21991.1 Diacylglycerol acyltransferase - like 7 [Theobroma cacao]
MAATRACQFLAGSSVMSTSGNSGRDRGVSLSRRMAVSTEQISSAATTTTSFVENGRPSEKKTKRRKEESELISNVYWNLDEMTEENRKKLKDYFEECKDLIRSDGGPPRWFSPLECGSHTPDSPLLLFLPDLVKLVERTVSGKDQLLPSQEEVQRLRRMLPKSEIRLFEESGHFLFLEDDVDLVTSIKGASFYRRGKYLDYVSDYIPPTPYEFKKIYESNRWVVAATSPVMLSTLEDGEVVRGLAGIPSEGPVLYVGYHMLLGFELAPMVIQFFMERNILLRGIAHPMMFFRLREGNMVDLAAFDTFRLMGAVPVSGPNFYKLLSSKSHVLLYPGGVREALHRKGEEYKLFWPERSEFVRMASRFGTKIVPFGVVGEDDVGELVFDYNDQMHIPPLRSFIKELTEESVQLRTDANGEVSNQDVHLPGVLPKLPGRFYYYFGKPIETEGRKQELRNSEISQELYLHVKSEVERCMAYLKEKREKDPYRNLLPRLLYRATHGFTAEVPTFEL